MTPVFQNWKNISDLLNDVKEGKIKENMDNKYFSNRASYFGNPVGTADRAKFIFEHSADTLC